MKNYYDIEAANEIVQQKVCKLLGKCFANRPNDFNKAIDHDIKTMNKLLNSSEDIEVIKYVVASMFSGLAFQFEAHNNVFMTLEEILKEQMGEEKYAKLADRVARMVTNKFLQEAGMGVENMLTADKFMIMPDRE